MYWDSFNCEIQSDEIIPEEYDNWMRFCYSDKSSKDEDISSSEKFVIN